MSDLWQELEKKLKNHDWYYAFSDDSRWYHAGLEESSEIIRLMKILSKEDEARAQELLQRYSPK